AEQEAQERAEEEARRKAEEGRVAAEAEAQRRADEGERLGDEAEVSLLSGDEEASSSRGERKRSTTQYRPSRTGPPAVRKSTNSTDAGDGQPKAGRKRAADIEVRLLFERGGYCKIALLLRRPEGLPEECTLLTNAGSIDILAVGDEWYQDLVPDGLGAVLRNGIVWTDKSSGQDWLLSGREIFVLGAGTTHRGFVSCSHMVLGREHAVLCTTSTLHAVEEVLREAGCGTWKQMGEDDGAPQGWVILNNVDGNGRVRGLVPQIPVPLVDGADIFNALRPRPEIEIALEGGLSLGYSSWLAGYPPAIRVYGDPAHTQTVLIDGQEAAASEQGSYTALGWDEPRFHQVWCNNVSKTYSLIQLERTWKAWAAYSFPLPPSRGAFGTANRIAVCGPLVCPFADAEAFGEVMDQRRIIHVVPTNPVLLGAMPGQVLEAVSRRDVRGAQGIASPSFLPVWALPAQPLACDKRSTRILLVGELDRPCSIATGLKRSETPPGLYHWCRLILDAGRKGLAVEPPTDAAVELWRQYKRHARGLWRRAR
ncbi:MAG: hypothetical protein HY270_17590, partial [Deltaproteobacteria bacterium]|nr:hypothetical protein [Deltaproteobacteria bacterium]